MGKEHPQPQTRACRPKNTYCLWGHSTSQQWRRGLPASWRKPFLEQMGGTCTHSRLHFEMLQQIWNQFRASEVELFSRQNNSHCHSSYDAIGWSTLEAGHIYTCITAKEAALSLSFSLSHFSVDRANLITLNYLAAMWYAEMTEYQDAPVCDISPIKSCDFSHAIHAEPIISVLLTTFFFDEKIRTLDLKCHAVSSVPAYLNSPHWTQGI